MSAYWFLSELIYSSIQIKRSGEMARKLRFFKDQMLKSGLPPPKATRQADLNLDDLEVLYDVSLSSKRCFVLYVLTLILCVCQVKLGELEAELIEINANSEKLQRSYNELVEYKLVLQKVTAPSACSVFPTMQLVLLGPQFILYPRVIGFRFMIILTFIYGKADVCYKERTNASLMRE